MPLLIAAITFASRKWGNIVGGIIAGLPWVGGAILLFIAIEQGKSFVVEALPAVYIGLLSWMAYTIIYVVIGQRLPSYLTLFTGIIGYLIVGSSLQRIVNQFSPMVWFGFAWIGLLVTLKFFPKVKENGQSESIKNIKFEIPLRMLMITAFVVALTYFARPLGPEWSGILTPFPVITAVLTVFTHLSQGMKQVRVILVGMYTGVSGFLSFLLILIFMLPNSSIAFTYTVAGFVSIISALLAKVIFGKFSLFS